MRVYNFSAGPSVLPEWVLKRAAKEMLNYNESGQSVMELSHRSAVFEEILNQTELKIRRILNISDDYQILFLQGGASSQFAMIPLNLMTKSKRADFVITGLWAKKAYSEASRYGKTRIVASSEDRGFSYIPELSDNCADPESDYFHITLNNTIYGTVYRELPQTGDVPLVADISSCALSEPLDISRFGLLYAGAQKNMGAAGLTVVIIRKDLIGEPMENTPTMFNYQIHAKSGSLYNTPPTYAIYICGLVLRWLEEEIGGLENMGRINREKASVLYDFLDQSKLFSATVKEKDRSLMNVPFVTGDVQLDKAVIARAEKEGLVNLKGHRTVGGMRASIYNAMPKEGVEKLVDFLNDFEKHNI